MWAAIGENTKKLELHGHPGKNESGNCQLKEKIYIQVIWGLFRGSGILPNNFLC